MKRGIHIYLDGEEIEFIGTPTVLYNYAVKDLQNPTISRNTFSKKLTVPGTPKNNRIFGSIWNLEGGSFNAGRKTDFSIYVDDELYETGYAKLDAVNRKWNTTTYTVSLYGGLGDFFFNLNNRPEDASGVNTKKTLADLVYRYEPDSSEVDLSFDITKETVKDAWDNLQGWSTKWRFVNFAPCYDGTPSDFDSSKVLNFGYREEVHDGGKTYVPFENWWTVDELPREHTGAEMREFRSYLQRPVVRCMEVVKACCLPENNGGYTVNLDPTFFSNNNPYWYDAYSTLTMLSSLEYVGQEQDSAFTVTLASGYTTGGVKGSYWSGYTETRGLTMGNPQGKAFNISMDFAVEADFGTAPSPSLYDEIRTAGWNTRGNGGGKGNRKRGLYSIITMQLVAYDPFGQVVAGSKVAMLSSQWTKDGYYPDASKLTERGWKPVYGNEYVLYKGAFKYSGGKWVWENGINLSIEQVPSNCTVKLVVDKETEYIHVLTGTNAKTLDGYNPDNRHCFTGITMDHFNIGVVGYDASVSTGEGVRSGAHITKEMLLSTDFTPAQYLISYCKLFGLYFRKDPARKVIDIMQRGTFYTGDSEDISDRLDRQDLTITPVTFDKRWYRFGLEESESEYGDDYRKVYGQQYGDALINTGYEFNADTEEVYDDNVFNSAVEVVERSDAFAVISGSPKELIYTRRGFDYSLYANNVVDDTVDVEVPAGSTFDISTGMDGETRYYDLFPKVQLHTADNSPADGNNVLLFFRGMQELNTPSMDLNYRITDDSEIMYRLNDGTPTWLASESEYDQYGHDPENRIMIKAESCPSFGRYIVYGPSGYITKSWDFGEPKTLYIPNAVSREDGTLYAQCWKDYISDLYNQDTRIVETKVRFDGRVSIDTLRKFYWFDGHYWAISKITDWDMLGRGLTKVEFVKVNDPANYSSQTITKDPTIEVTLSAYEVGISGGTISFSAVTSDNGSWYAEYDPDYITMSPDHASASTVGTITIGQNTGGDIDHVIYFFADPASVKVTIGQASYKGSIEYLGTSLSGGTSSDIVPDTGGTIYLKVVANGPWTLNGRGTMSQSAGTETTGTTVSVVIPANTYQSVSDFYYTLTLPNGTYTRSQYIRQAGAGNPSITVSPSNRTSPSSGESFYVTVNSNVPWTAYTNYNFLTLSANSGTTGETQVLVTVASNDSSQRTDMITFRSQDAPGNVLATTYVTQEAYVDLSNKLWYKSQVAITPNGGTAKITDTSGHTCTVSDSVMVSQGEFAPHWEFQFSTNYIPEVLSGATFSGNTNLTAFRWYGSESGDTALYGEAFKGCTALETVEIYGRNKGCYYGNVFEGCTSLKSVVVNFATTGNSMTTGDYGLNGFLFSGCTALESVDMSMPYNYWPNVNSIFTGATSLQTITIRKCGSTGTFGANKGHMFYDIPSLNTVNLENISYISFSTTSVKLFYKCPNLAHVYWSGTMQSAQTVFSSQRISQCSAFTVHCTDGDYSVASTL